MLDAANDIEIMRELGARIRALRIARNITAHDIAARAGLSATTVINAEAGRNPRLETVVKLLRELGRLDALDAFIPAPTMAPLDLLKRRGRPRQRASGSPRGQG
ncbi:MAG: helix-turn-helix transcriptional regulator [Gemmatimonadetes bacterium]|nr:helix-turn-helix transcriptional regulator [Gemmatimonadota bacterium]